MNNTNLPEGIMLNNRYEILSVLGSGGFGITYLAFDHLVNSSVSVKEFFPSDYATRDSSKSMDVIFDDDEQSLEKIKRARDDFDREERILRYIKNVPYVDRFRDSFESNNTKYIVKNYIEGKSLSYLVKKHHKLSSSWLLEKLVNTVDALSMLHKLGIIHRDICPGNLIINSMGDLFLIDFGGAISVDITSENYTLSTVDHQGFNAPEYNDVTKQGPWTDIYSLCATFFYLLTGEGLRLAENRAVCDDLPERLLKLKLTKSQQNAIIHGLTVEVNRRTSDAAALKRELFSIKPVEHPAEYSVRFSFNTDICSRKLNQDTFVMDRLFTYTGEDYGNSGCMRCEKDKLYMIAVCDGVGGSCHGEISSRAAAQALVHFLENYGDSQGLPERLLERFFDQLNEKIIELGEKVGRHIGEETGITSSTVSVLLWKNDEYYAMNIGDSPIYHMQRKSRLPLSWGKLIRISTPHTLANAKILAGKHVTPRDFRTLSNYLGKKGVSGSEMVSYTHGHIRKNDCFLVCSDGLTDAVSKARMEWLIRLWGPTALGKMWKTVKKARNNDNCTAIIVKFAD